MMDSLASAEELARLQSEGMYAETFGKSRIAGVDLVTYKVRGTTRDLTLSVPDWLSSSSKALQLHFPGFRDVVPSEEGDETTFPATTATVWAQQLELEV